MNLVHWSQLPRCLLVHWKSIWTSYQNSSASLGSTRSFSSQPYLFSLIITRLRWALSLSQKGWGGGEYRSWSMYLRRSVTIYWPNPPLKFRLESGIRAKNILITRKVQNMAQKWISPQWLSGRFSSLLIPDSQYHELLLACYNLFLILFLLLVQ